MKANTNVCDHWNVDELDVDGRQAADNWTANIKKSLKLTLSLNNLILLYYLVPALVMTWVNKHC
jgi:hypothetical protein